MAQRRMFSPKIIDSDAFLEMPISVQCLYFHLGMRADDDGFVSNPKKIMRVIGANEDDLKVLIAKRFILTFESGVIVIKHWRINNLIRKDWHKDTVYVEEKKLLKLKENNAYTELVNENATIRQHSIDKISIDKYIYSKTSSEKEFNSEDYINHLIQDKKQYLSLIGKFMKEKGCHFPDKATANKELKRWLKDAATIVKYPKTTQDKAFDYVINKFSDIWNLNTVVKYISQEIIWK